MRLRSAINYRSAVASSPESRILQQPQFATECRFGCRPATDKRPPAAGIPAQSTGTTIPSVWSEIHARFHSLTVLYDGPWPALPLRVALRSDPPALTNPAPQRPSCLPLV